MDNQKPKSKLRGCLKIFLILMGISFLAQVISAIVGIGGHGEEPKNNKEITTNNKPKHSISDSIEMVEDLITFVKEQKNTKIETAEKVGGFLRLFEESGQMYYKYQNSKNPEILKKIEELKKETKKLQVSKLPIMRKIHVKELGKKLWRSNIDVIDKGTTVELIGGVFANNANKEDFYKEMGHLFYNLRFKRVNMKWYKYDEEYTYYETGAKKDDELYRELVTK